MGFEKQLEVVRHSLTPTAVAVNRIPLGCVAAVARVIDVMAAMLSRLWDGLVTKIFVTRFVTVVVLDFAPIGVKRITRMRTRTHTHERSRTRRKRAVANIKQITQQQKSQHNGIHKHKKQSHNTNKR